MNSVVLVGNGKLADAFERDFNNYSPLPIKKYTPECISDSKTVFVHIGSGRQYKESLLQAQRSGACYIQAATQKNIPLEPPVDPAITYIHAPNLDITIIKLFYLLNKAGTLFNNECITITESHQKEKTSQPGTAHKFCEYLHIPTKSIVSIRDPELQKKIPVTNLQQHAYHKIQIGPDNANVTITTKIEGSKSYLQGLARIIACLPRISHGCYEVDDLISLQLL